MIKMASIKAVFFDLDNTLYNTSRLAEMSRRNAVRAMIEAGLPAGEDEAMKKLLAIVRKKGPNYDHHYDRLLASYGIKKSPRIIAAGVAAYHATKTAYLVPYRETVPTLLKLRDMGLKLGVITNGLAVKQWEKIIRLGLQHFFHTVVVSEDEDVEKPGGKIFLKAARRIKAKPVECVMVGDRVDQDIAGASKVGFTTVQVVRAEVGGKPAKKTEEPDYVIGDLTPIPELISRIC